MMSTETLTLADVKVGDWLLVNRSAAGFRFSASTAILPVMRVTAKRVSTRMDTFDKATGRCVDKFNRHDSARPATAEEVAQHLQRLQAERASRKAFIENQPNIVEVTLPPGLTAAEAQHRLATWQGLRDYVASSECRCPAGRRRRITTSILRSSCGWRWRTSGCPRRC
jgi:hypothetical protein